MVDVISEVVDERLGQREIMRRRRAASRDLHIPECLNPKRRARSKNNLALFKKTYFPHLAYLKSAPFQIARIKKTEQMILYGGNAADAEPRGTGKTTEAMIAAIWALLYGKKKYFLVVRANADESATFIENTKGELERNDLLWEDFPEVCVPIRALEGQPQRAASQTVDGVRTFIKWKADRIVLPTIEGSEASGGILGCVGIEGKIRGLLVDGSRPDFILIDDPETLDSVKSETISKTIEDHITKDIGGLGGPGHIISTLWRCTVIRRGCLADQYTNRDLHPEWNGARRSAMEKWPDRMDLWDAYLKKKEDGARDGDDTTGRAATAFYRKNRRAMDVGALAVWKQNYVRQKGPDGKPLELSAIQHLFNELYRLGEKAFLSEYQNDPPIDDGFAEGLTQEIVADSIGGHPKFIVPADHDILVQGIDLGARLIEFQVKAFAPDGSSSTVDYKAMPTNAPKGNLKNPKGDLKEALEARILEALEARRDAELAGIYVDENGNPRSIDLTLVDSGYMTDVVYRFVKSSGKKFRAIKGLGTGKKMERYKQPKPAKGIRVGNHWYRKHQRGKPAEDIPNIWLYLLEVDHWKEYSHQRWLQDLGTPGAAALFGDDPREHLEIARQITAEQYDVEKKEWVKIRAANHYLDTDGYTNAAAEMLGYGVFRQVNTKRLPRGGGGQTGGGKNGDWVKGGVTKASGWMK